MSEAEGATLKVKVAVKPEVTLGDYAGLNVTKKVRCDESLVARDQAHAGPQRPPADP